MTQDEQLMNDAIEEATKGEPMKAELPEAPMSINIRGYYKGFSVQLTKRLDENSLELQIPRVVGVIQKMIEYGYKPSWNEDTNGKTLAPQTPATAPQVALQATPASSPVCGIHRTPMVWKTGISKKTGKPYAFWSCAQKDINGDYCQYKVK